MPTDQRLGTDDREDRQDRWKPAIAVCEFDAPAQLAPQNDQLMSERGIFGLKPDLRLEWRGQGGQNETQKPDHSASLGDSITSSTRIAFSVHTIAKPRFTRPPSAIVGGDFAGPEAAKRLAGAESGEGCEQLQRGEYVQP